MEDRENALSFNFGRLLHASPHDVKHLFQRVTNWSRDQQLSALNGVDPAKETIADGMARAWSAIFWVSHATTGWSLQRRFDKIITILSERQVPDAVNEALVGQVSPVEMADAIKRLKRLKAGALDVLSNNLFRDASDALLGALAKAFTAIIDGASTPLSSRGVRLFPLRNKGNSPDPSDYRPITMLPTSYKVFVSVLTSQLQQHLGQAVGTT